MRDLCPVGADQRDDDAPGQSQDQRNREDHGDDVTHRRALSTDAHVENRAEQGEAGGGDPSAVDWPRAACVNPQPRQQRRADRADCCSFRGCCDTAEDRAKDGHDEHDGRRKSAHQATSRNGDRLGAGDGRPGFGPPQTQDELIGDIYGRQHQTGDHRPGEKLADGNGLDREFALCELCLLVGGG
jgi:hypothetical protein